MVVPCSLKSCINHALCASKSGSVECRCPEVRDCPAVKIPVCGSDGTTHKVYNNRCFMKVDSCRMGKRISPVPTEKCGENSFKTMHSVFITLSVPIIISSLNNNQVIGSRTQDQRARRFCPFRGISVCTR